MKYVGGVFAMPKTPEAYLKEPYSRILIPNDEGGYSAEILEFPGCFAEGDTADETMQALERAAESWIQATLDQGQDIPQPFMNQGYGGKIALRLPRSLHRQAARLAERDGVSLNQFLVSAIAEHVGARDCFSWIKEKLTGQWDTRAQHIQGVAFNTIRNLNVAITAGPQQTFSGITGVPEGQLVLGVSVPSARVVRTATTPSDASESDEKEPKNLISRLTEAFTHG
jgi:predicted RNase H-like HicB family nuclease